MSTWITGIRHNFAAEKARAPDTMHENIVSAGRRHKGEDTKPRALCS